MRTINGAGLSTGGWSASTGPASEKSRGSSSWIALPSFHHSQPQAKPKISLSITRRPGSGSTMTRRTASLSRWQEAAASWANQPLVFELGDLSSMLGRSSFPVSGEWRKARRESWGRVSSRGAECRARHRRSPQRPPPSRCRRRLPPPTRAPSCRRCMSPATSGGNDAVRFDEPVCEIFQPVFYPSSRPGRRCRGGAAPARPASHRRP
jgi:hypothetical protein